ncbi:hypothetical protein [Chloroflexus sp.]|uniref:hypothetical protein n=1 Tax=Chloroflexus sp. TaxID=1904827 RepID=UPI0026064C94|nr:hypothetical protein [uncultured Chloroflexus sp.]
MRQPSLIDILAAGYALIHRQPFILLFSIGLSAYLWLGSPITLLLPDLGAQGIFGQWLGTLHAIDARTLLVVANYIPLLTPGAEITTPPPQALPDGVYLLTVLILNGITLGLSGAFLASLRQLLQREQSRLATMLARSLSISLRLGGVLIIIGSVLAPLAALSILLAILLPTAIPFLYTGWIALGVIGFITFGFTPEVITLHHHGPLAALRASWQFARRRWFSIATFLALCAVIEVGFAHLWRALAAQPGWLAPAIVGNAYIGSGLRAARLQLYLRYANR